MDDNSRPLDTGESASSGEKGVSKENLDGISLLTVQYLDGAASAQEIEQLKAILASQPELAKEFVGIALREAHLSEQYSPEQLLEDLLRSSGSKGLEQALRAPGGRQIVSAQSDALRPMTYRLAGTTLWLAASLLMLLTGYLLYHASLNQGGDPVGKVASGSGEEAVVPGDNVLAKITGKVDCVWEDEKWSLGNRTHLFIGDVLRLEQGLVELQYLNGTVVLVEGPAQFSSVSDLEISLDYGSVSVKAAEGVEGFEVATPSSRVIDVGTEFGVSVSQTGLTQLKVYDGEVRLEKTKEAPIGSSLTLTEKPTSESKKKARSDYLVNVTEDFLTQRSLEIEDPLVVPDLPVTDNLALWLSAASCVKRDQFNRVVGWGDILVGDNQRRESAWQVAEDKRPTWVHDGMLGHPALSFDGKSSYLVTEPLATTDEQTITVLVRAVGQGDRNRPRGNQIINYAGPPSIVLRYNWRKAGFAGKAFVGHLPESVGPSAWINVGRVPGTLFVDEEPPQYRPPQLCSYVFSSRGNSAKLFIDGQLVAEKGASGNVAIFSSKVIGAHRAGEDAYFNGYISELLIHNESLSDEQVLSLHSSLIDRYDIKVD